MSLRRLLIGTCLWAAPVSCLAPSQAFAQLALPGAAAPTEEGAVVTPGEAAKPRLKKRSAASGEDEAAAGPAVAPKPPSEDGVIGKELKLDGSRSSLELRRGDGKLQISRLTLMGDSIARSGESCRVEVSGMPMKLEPREDDSGLHRYQADFPACPFFFSVLDGAVLVTNEGGACEIKAADCRSDPRGLWGESDFDTKRAKEMLGLRARVEKTVRADFRSLIAKYQKDRPMRNYLVQVQVGFSARREDICRGYAKEEDVGYCALRVTEARALTLGAQLARGAARPDSLSADLPPKKSLKRIGR